MARGRTIGVWLTLALFAAGCGSRSASLGALSRSLREQYPGVRVHVQLASGGRNLWIRVDSAAWRNYRLAGSELQARTTPIARFALQHYGGAPAIDSVTIEVVQETSGALLWRSWSSQTFTSAATSLR